MRKATLIGLLLVVLGVAGLIYEGFSYTTDETVIDLGKVRATAEERHRVEIPPILGVLSVTGGVVLLIAGGRNPVR